MIVSATRKEGIPPPSGEIPELRDSELLCRDDSDDEHENQLCVLEGGSVRERRTESNEERSRT